MSRYFTPRLGSEIGDVLREALKFARHQQQTVTFDFNGETVLVQPGDRHAQLLDDWNERRHAAQRAYVASRAYVQDEVARAEGTRAAQERLNRLIDRVNDVARNGLRPALEWLVEFSRDADHTDVQIPHARLARTLATLAPADAHVGRTDLEEPGREEAAAEWAIGQAVSFLQRGVPPHPIIGYRAEQLLARWPTDPR